MDIANALAEFGIKVTLVLPSVFGGLIALYFVNGNVSTLAHRAAVVASGTGLGLFCAPLAVDAFSLPDTGERLEKGFSILIAALGMAILANIIKAGKEVKWSEIIESWFKRK